MKTSKTKKVTVGLLTASVAISPISTLAMSNTEGAEKHEVPVLGIEGGNNKISPEQSFDISVNKEGKEFKSVRQQLEKQSFGVLITSSSGNTIFLDAQKNSVQYSDGKVSVKDPSLARYTSYQATILVKSEYQHALKGKFPTVGSNPISFETGSAVGEATKVSAQLETKSVSVTEVGKLVVNITDDYGNQATNATLNLLGVGTGNERVASEFSAPKQVKITNGVAEIPLSDKSAGLVNLTYTVVDNTFDDAKEISGTTVMEFTPGQMSSVVDYIAPSEVKAGESGTLSGTAVDVYGNAIAEGKIQVDIIKKNPVFKSRMSLMTLEQPINLETQVEEIVFETTANGQFTYTFTAPVEAGTYIFSIRNVESGTVIEEPLLVTASTPSNVVINIPPNLTTGNNTNVSGTVKDEYGNPIVNQEVVLGGALTGTIVTGDDGFFSGPVKVGNSGNVTASVGGVTTPLTNSNGQPITNVISKPATLTPATVKITSYPTRAYLYSTIVIKGIVQDAEGKGMAGQTVRFTDNDGVNRSVVSGADGSWTFNYHAYRYGTKSLKAQSGSAYTTMSIYVYD